MRGYLNSVIVSITAAAGYTIVYQVINNPASNTYGASFTGDLYWKDDVPVQTYISPFTLNEKNSDKLILAKVFKNNSNSGVAGYQLNIL